MSIPVPKSLHAADVCRDGGSYVLVYVDAAGFQHEVELPVILGPGSAGRVGYREPVVKSYASGESSVLSWAEAASLSRQLAPLVGGSIEWGGVPRAREGVELLSLGGKLPSDA